MENEHKIDWIAKKNRLIAFISNGLDILDDPRYSERAKAMIRTQVSNAQDELRKIGGWASL